MRIEDIPSECLRAVHQALDELAHRSFGTTDSMLADIYDALNIDPDGVEEVEFSVTVELPCPTYNGRAFNADLDEDISGILSRIENELADVDGSASHLF